MALQILLPPKLRLRLEDALGRAGRQEIGGIVMGEQLCPDRFRIAELTVQRRGGAMATFVRSLRAALRALHRFFDRTDHEYTRFNYLGEWHSHPSFRAVPSPTDRSTMEQLVMDPRVGATFAVLLIAKLDGAGELEATATVFRPNGEGGTAELVFEEDHD